MGIPYYGIVDAFCPTGNSAAHVLSLNNS